MSLLLAAALLLGGPDALGIVPQPRSVVAYAATYTLPQRITIAASSDDERNVADFAIAFLRAHGVDAAIAPPSTPGAQLRLSSGVRSDALGGEGYHLHVGDDGIAITANSGPGLFYGLQTLEQLFPQNSNVIHYAEIDDAPAYKWRGIHLDVSRHFFGVPVVERYIDVAAHYKFNTFHWHLTDDQGWRIQIKRYPQLTQVGSCREGTQIGHDESDIDGKRYCGYYTQDQIREVVAYAKKRYITIVPEIEMPGHSSAAVAAYPWLTCAPGHYKVLPYWGVSDYIFCPTPRTFAFLRGVLSEVIDLFPGTYIHIGGDEVPKAAWKASPFVHALMRRENLKTYDRVQGYFTRTIEQFLISKGRRMVGWDEILDGGVSRTATIMSWRGIAGGIAAAQRGNDVVMSPDPPLYLDHYQGDPTVEPIAIGGYTTLEHLYNYDPMPPGLTPEQQTHVLGAQGNLWTEYIPTEDMLFYRLLPRELAIAELNWTPAQQKNWPGFEQRMSAQYAWLEAQHFPFHIPNPEMALQGTGAIQIATLQPNLRSLSATVASARVTLIMNEAVPGAAIYYTFDGTRPSEKSSRYDRPLTVDIPAGKRIEVHALAVLPDGRKSFTSTLVLYRSP
jgi:hexosaminidase